VVVVDRDIQLNLWTNIVSSAIDWLSEFTEL